MKNSTILSIVICFVSLIGIAQPANDLCTNAQVITIPASGNICINSTNVGATSDMTTNACDVATPGNEVWFTYVATGGSNSVTVTPNGATPATNMVVSIQSTPCASGTYNACNSGTAGAAVTTSFAYALGTQVWICVETNGTDGTFQLCVNSVSQPPAPGNSCGTATPICNKNTFTVNPFPVNINVITPGCFPTPFQRPIFYKFTVGQSGTCIWTVDPLGLAEYDWVMYDITSGCPGTEVCCNFNYSNSAGDPIGMSAAAPNNCGTAGAAGPPEEFSPPANVIIGRTYLIVIDNWSDNNVGFTMSWGGTFEMAPNPAFTATPMTGCAPLNVSFTNTSTATVSYDWDLGNGNSSVALTPPAQTYSTPGSYLVSLVGTSTSGCTNVEVATIVVNAPPTITPPANVTACASTTVASIPLATTPTGGTVSWTNSNTAIGLAASGTGNIPSFTATNATSAPITATITITPTLSGCPGTPQTFTITVNPTPTVTAESNVTACNGTAVAANTFASPVAGTTFSWTNSNTSIGLAASGTTSLPAFTATNAGTTAITSTISITPSANGCTGPVSTFTITVNPTPTVVAESNITICNGGAVAANTFASTPTGATFAWTNNTTSIGLAASGTTSLPAFTATNTGSTAVTATVSITPTLATCVGPVSTFTITVNPTPTIVSPGNSIVCNGTAVASPTINSTPAGATLAWTNTNTAIGLGASGTGSPSAFTATNTGTTGISGTISVTPTLSGCVGSPINYTITVNPTPTVTAEPNVTACAGTTVVANTFASTTAGTTFTWSNSNTGIGLAASGSTSLPSFTATNAGSTALTGTISVTPTASGCIGPVSTFTITINPTPTVTTVPPVTVCSGTAIPSVTLAGPVAGTTYAWTNSNTAIGLGASGTNTVNAFTTTNASGSPISGTVTITPTANGCTGTPGTYVITVSPVPTVNPVANSTYCNGVATTAVAFSGSVAGTTFGWTNNNTATGLAANGTGNIASYTATNTGTTAISSTVTVTPSVGSCIGSPTNFTITVNPTPTVDPVTAVTVCTGATIPSTTFTGSVASTTYNWTNSNTAVGLGASGTNTTPSFTATNATGSPISSTVTITPSANTCTGTPGTYTITVNPIPTVNAVANSTYCPNDATTAINFSGNVPTAQYDWTNNNTNIGLAANGTGNIGTFTASNTGTAVETATITVTPSASGCSGTPITFTITVNPTPVITPITNQFYCTGSTAPINTVTVAPGTSTVTWTNDNGSIGLATSGNGNIPSFTTTNATTGTITGNIQISATFGSCTSTSTFTIDVGPTPTLTAVTNQTFCANTNSTAVNFVANPAISTVDWTNSNAAIGLGASGTGNIPTFTGTNSGSTAISGTITATPSVGTCIGTPITFTITISPIPSVTAGNNTPICEGNDINLTSTSTVAGSAFSWSGPSAYASGQQNPTITAAVPTQSGTYTVTATAAGCTGTATTNVIVNPIASPTINPIGPFCVNAGTATLTVSAAGGTWSGPGIIDPFTGTFDPAIAGAGTHTITYAITGSCPTQATTTITVNPLPTVAFSAPILSGCVPFTANLVDNSSPSSASVTWDFGDGSTSNQTGSVTHTFNQVGCFTITLTSTSSAGCTNTASIANYICVNPYAVASFTSSATEVSFLNTEVLFNNNSANADTYSWQFGDGTTSNATSPLHTFPEEIGSYDVMLVANNAGNCPDTARMTIVIKGELVFFVPNAFTPDGDEYNNTFQPVFTAGFDPFNWNMLIFNRWGEIIFETNDATIGWDGTYHNEMCKEGVYTWKISFKDPEVDKHMEYHGHVTLLK